MERDFTNGWFPDEGDAEFEFTEKNIALIHRMAESALQPGLIVQPNDLSTDYVESVLPGLR